MSVIEGLIVYVPAPKPWLPRQQLRTFVTWLILLLVGCANEPPATVGTSTLPLVPTSTSAPSPTPNPAPTAATAARPVAPTAAPLGVTAPVTQTGAVAPLARLRNTTIIDRLATDMLPLTDGTVKYKLAAWSPGGEWIAVTPQDGPGLDVVNARSGEVRAIITDTYVLEPVWLQQDVLVVQQLRPAGDQLVQFPIDSTQHPAAVLVSSVGPLHAVSAADGFIAYGTADNQLHASGGGAPNSQWTALLKPLVTAPAPHAAESPTIAVTLYVNNLEQVQTVLVQPTAEGLVSKPLSEVGEGLWLPRWAPDGTKLALTSIGGRIISTSVDGQRRYDLGPGDSPAWSADSTRLAFAGTSAGEEFISRDIHVVDWQGAGPRLRLTDANEEQFYTSPTWSPAGTRLAFIEIDSGQLFVIDIPSS